MTEFTRAVAAVLVVATLAFGALSCSKPAEEPAALPSGQDPAALVAPQNPNMAGKAAQPAAPTVSGGNMPSAAQMQQP